MLATQSVSGDMATMTEYSRKLVLVRRRQLDRYDGEKIITGSNREPSRVPAVIFTSCP